MAKILIFVLCKDLQSPKKYKHKQREKLFVIALVFIYKEFHNLITLH
jgi:hypothetical protein